MSNIVTTNNNAVPSLKSFTDKITSDDMKAYLAKTLNDKKDVFTMNLISVVSNNKNLQKCKFETLLFGAMRATTFNFPLDNNLGFAYLIPYGNDAQFQMGYKGYIQLGMRSGMYNTMNVTDIREGELVHRNLLSGKMEFAEVENREKKKIIGYAAYFELHDGYNKCLYMSVEELQRHGETYSPTYKINSSLWRVNFDSMAKKTVIKLLLKRWGLLSPEMREAIEADQAVFYSDDMKPIYVDSPENVIKDVQTEIVEEQGKEIINIDVEQNSAQTVAPF